MYSLAVLRQYYRRHQSYKGEDTTYRPFHMAVNKQGWLSPLRHAETKVSTGTCGISRRAQLFVAVWHFHLDETN